MSTQYIQQNTYKYSIQNIRDTSIFTDVQNIVIK